MNPTKPTPHIPEDAQEVLDRLRAGSALLLRACGRCGERNRIARGPDLDPPVQSEFVLVRDCTCVVGEKYGPMTEDGVIAYVMAAIAAFPPELPKVPVWGPSDPVPPVTRFQPVGHLYFDVDSVSCSVCGGSEPLSVKGRVPFKTVMRALDAIVALHPDTPHPYSASL